MYTYCRHIFAHRHRPYAHTHTVHRPPEGSLELMPALFSFFHRYKDDSVLAARYQPGKLQPMRSMVSDTLINDVGRFDEAFLNIFICAALH